MIMIMIGKSWSSRRYRNDGGALLATALGALLAVAMTLGLLDGLAAAEAHPAGEPVLCDVEAGVVASDVRPPSDPPIR